MKRSNLYYYLALQYSAIQKTVLRHDRLWSIIGISQILAEINEIKLPEIVAELGGQTLISGGGKFTAKFDNPQSVDKAKQQIVKHISTLLPMLEFQCEIVSATSLSEAKEQGLLNKLNEQKNKFRGYGVSFNPHIKLCSECGEYPCIVDDFSGRKKYTGLFDACNICSLAKSKDIDFKESIRTKFKNVEKAMFTTLEEIYSIFFDRLKEEKNRQQEFLESWFMPLDFESIVSASADDSDDEKRMAVWFSDLNNMNQKVPIWLSEDDGTILNIFKTLKSIQIRFVSEALFETFKNFKGRVLPFRLIVAGGDDLRLVMAEKYILNFVKNLSKSLIDNIETNKYKWLSEEWLREKRSEYFQKIKGKENLQEQIIQDIKPYSFGGAFVLTPIHTPFRKIHEACEELVSESKRKTDRNGNSVNWSVLSVEESDSSTIEFHKPLFIEKEDAKRNGQDLSFNDYLEMRDFYRTMLSGSQIQMLAERIRDFRSIGKKFEHWLKQTAVSSARRGYGYILVDQRFRKGFTENGEFDCSRLATLLELLTIKSEDRKNE